ncbi:hypothetical protein GCM10020216_030640 [Nonomuraea helvata]
MQACSNWGGNDHTGSTHRRMPKVVDLDMAPCAQHDLPDGMGMGGYGGGTILGEDGQRRAGDK